MKTFTQYLSLFIMTIILFYSCEEKKPDNNTQGFDIDIDENKYYDEEIFTSHYLSIYDKWRLTAITGGLWGIGYTPDFEFLVVQEIGIFKIYRNDSLLVYGSIEIQRTDEYGLLIFFRQDSILGEVAFFDMQKYLDIKDSAMILGAPCCDRFNYHFISCQEYSDPLYYQENPELENVAVTELNAPAGKDYTCLFFVNENIGFVSCSDKSILKTTDGGGNWVEYYLDTEYPLNSLFFVNEDTGYAIGGCLGSYCNEEGTAVYRTDDGGIHWAKQTALNYSELRSICFINDSTGFAVGGTLLKTNNGGKQWNKFRVDNTGIILKVWFLNENTGFMCGVNNNLFRTDNGGESWVNLTDLTPPEKWHFYDIQFVNENIGYLSGENCGLLKTLDGGISFEELDYSPGGINYMHFKTETEGIVFGGKTYSTGNCDSVWNPGLHLTIDGGLTWQGDNRIKGYVKSASFPSEYICYEIVVSGYGIENGTQIIKIEFH